MSDQFDSKRKAFEIENNITYNEEGYYIKNKSSFIFKKSKITVVSPVYNAENFLRKTIDSVINQSIGFKNIEYILVDDGSTDSSREILLEYADTYKNIMVVFLKNNTGTPAQPRNLGIKLAKSDYITFLDADDWLDKDGLKSLYTVIKGSNDDYIVGKTIEVGSKGNKIVGEYESCKERRNVSPFSIPHLFHHLGPRARMMKLKLLKDYNIQYPEMKFAEDKQFFIDVLIHCKSISTTTQVVYYLNRMDDNDASLTKQTDVMEKMDTNIRVINYVKSKQLDIEKEKMILNRLYEFDSITRLFNRYHFLKSEDTEEYFNKFQEVIDTTKDLSYDVSESFFHPINKVAYDLFLEGRYDDIKKLYKWDKKEKIKNYVIENNLPYMNVPLSKEKNKQIRVPMLALFHGGSFFQDRYTLTVDIYGDHVQKVQHIVLRDRKNVTQEYKFPLNVNENGRATAELDLETLNQLKSSSYEVFVQYNDYQKLYISKKEQVVFNKRTFNFYSTINSNLGFRIN
ncbi:Putative glycosyltransferase EpsH [Peribacillus sp. Bi96]|uniref:glycosyltransferase family 2 protein n=1 Tax=unclassified Peribacillus TaxID=2675266 RepID=UPI001DD7289A|nr:glycosyltransferase family 2 protein [Peribacillus sp. Bi96]CAH0299780.1 Putative glycosyltransferase EpsH [Peribacillus sp. Bi96]